MTQFFLSSELFSVVRSTWVLSLLLFLLVLIFSFNPWWSDGVQGRSYFSFLVSFETVIVTNYVFSFGERSMRCWEKDTFFCTWALSISNGSITSGSPRICLFNICLSDLSIVENGWGIEITYSHLVRVEMWFML